MLGCQNCQVHVWVISSMVKPSVIWTPSYLFLVYQQIVVVLVFSRFSHMDNFMDRNTPFIILCMYIHFKARGKTNKKDSPPKKFCYLFLCDFFQKLLICSFYINPLQQCLFRMTACSIYIFDSYIFINVFLYDSSLIRVFTLSFP